MDVSESDLIIISPKAPPEVCGVSDLAYLTAQSLFNNYQSVKMGVQQLPAVAATNWDKRIVVDKWNTLLHDSIKSRRPTIVMLNYTPLSYAVTGLPLSLIKALKQFKAANNKNRIYVFVHETWSDDPNLKIHHATRNKLVKWAMEQIDKLADSIAVVTEEQKIRVEKVFTKKVSLNPVGSNILPPHKNDGLTSKRKPGEWVIFGLPHTRLWALEANLPVIKKLYELGFLKKLLSIGPVDSPYAIKEMLLIKENIGENVLTQLGAVKPEEVSQIMLGAEAALSGQPAKSIKKSGTFMALAAHAVPVVCEVPEDFPDPPGAGFFRFKEILENPAIFSSKAGDEKRVKLFEWYWSTRSWSAIGTTIHNWMQDSR